MDMYDVIKKDLKTGVWTFDEYDKFLDEVFGDSDMNLNITFTNYGDLHVLTLEDEYDDECRIFYSMIERKNLTLSEFSALYVTVMTEYIYARAREEKN